jgi:hypothetical protein
MDNLDVGNVDSSSFQRNLDCPIVVQRRSPQPCLVGVNPTPRSPVENRPAPEPQGDYFTPE